jgi:kynurenine 3-monooxygenase
MEKEALHIWPRKSFMMIALPNPDGSFTCTLFWEFEGPRSFASTKTDDQIRHFFEEEFPDAVPLMPSLLDEFKTNPTGSLVTIRCAPWFYKDKIVLVGDAAHAVVPFYGQGMNAAFEDCVVLDKCLAKFPQDRQRAFAEYFARRKENTDALANLAVQNFIEMRDKTASKAFRVKKKLDHLLEGVLPGIYLPLFRRGKTRPPAGSNCLRRPGGSFAADRRRRDTAYFSLREFSQPMHSKWALSVGRFLLLLAV